MCGPGLWPLPPPELGLRVGVGSGTFQAAQGLGLKVPERLARHTCHAGKRSPEGTWSGKAPGNMGPVRASLPGPCCLPRARLALLCSAATTSWSCPSLWASRLGTGPSGKGSCPLPCHSGSRKGPRPAQEGSQEQRAGRAVSRGPGGAGVHGPLLGRSPAAGPAAEHPPSLPAPARACSGSAPATLAEPV